MKAVTEEEFREFIEKYPRELDFRTIMICDPPIGEYNDFTLGRPPNSIVAYFTYGEDKPTSNPNNNNFMIRK